MAADNSYITRNIFMNQGSTWSQLFRVTIDPLYQQLMDLNGYKARMAVRTGYPAPTAVLELTTENGKITIDSVSSLITLFLASGDTEYVNFANPDDDRVELVYDLEVYNDTTADVQRVAMGTFTISREVTH